MLDIQSIEKLTLTRFIAHVVDHGRSQIRLSDLETPIDPDSQFPHEFFKRYIVNAFEDPDRRYAFLPAPRSSTLVSGAYERIKADPNTFVDGSKQIASHLYDVTRQSRYRKAIKPGDIMVALCEWSPPSHNGDSKRNSCLVILKIDPSEAILREVRELGGKQQVLFKSEDRVPAPSEKEPKKVQKIAVIAEQQELSPWPHDLLIVDHNLREKAVAQFFYSDFLDAALVRDPDADTKLLRDIARSVIAANADRVHPPLSGNEKASVSTRVESYLEAHDQTSPRLLASQIELPNRSTQDTRLLREALLEDLKSLPKETRRLQPEERVTINPRYAARINRRRTYHLDRDVTISGDRDDLEAILEIADQLDAQGRTVITIRTTRFDPR